jgi:hypothetical protein
LRQSYRGLVALSSLIGALSTLSGLLSGSVIVILQSAGAIAFCTYVAGTVGAALVGAAGRDRALRHPGVTVIVSVTIGSGLFVYAGGPWAMAAFSGILQVGTAVFGLVVLVGLAYLVYVAYERRERSRAPATKTCPDCANHVLVAARKCQYCGYRFDADS